MGQGPGTQFFTKIIRWESPS